MSIVWHATTLMPRKPSVIITPYLCFFYTYWQVKHNERETNYVFAPNQIGAEGSIDPKNIAGAIKCDLLPIIICNFMNGS